MKTIKGRFPHHMITYIKEPMSNHLYQCPLIMLVVYSRDMLFLVDIGFYISMHLDVNITFDRQYGFYEIFLILMINKLAKKYFTRLQINFLFPGHSSRPYLVGSTAALSWTHPKTSLWATTRSWTRTGYPASSTTMTFGRRDTA